MSEALLAFGPDGHLDEGGTHAFIDGALTDAEAARVVLHLRGCVACAARVAEARGLAAAASGVVLRLDDGVGAVQAVPRARPVARPVVLAAGRPPLAARTGLRAAAAALLVAGIGGSVYLTQHAVDTRAGVPTAVAVAPATPEVSPATAAPMMAPAPAAESSRDAGAASRALAQRPARAPLAQPRALPRAVPLSSPRSVPSTAPSVEQRADARAAVVASAPAAVPTGESSGVVLGEVRDATGRTLSAATVAVAGTAIRATTDDSGRFVLRDVPAGTATLLARRIGFAGSRTAVAVVPSDTARAALQMEPSATRLEATVATAAPTAVAPAGGAGAAPGDAEASVGRATRSDRRVRRSGFITPEPAGCYMRSDSARTPRATPIQLTTDGRVVTAAGVVGRWERVAAGDSLRVQWQTGHRAVILGPAADGWSGATVGLLRVSASRCEHP